jgi:hypothetical protein
MYLSQGITSLMGRNAFTSNKFIGHVCYRRQLKLHSSLKTVPRELTWPRNWAHLACTFPCDFYLWVSLKDKLYKTNPYTLEELRNNICHEI